MNKFYAKYIGLSIYQLDNRYYVYLVVDLGKATTTPILLWSNYYKRRENLDKILEVCVNTGLTLLLYNTKDRSVLSGEKIVAQLKFKYFRERHVPVKWLTENEYLNRYKKLSKRATNILDI